MAISEEAYEYLREIEMIPGWTNIPDDDLRIVKLRVLFGVNPYKEKKQQKHHIKGKPIEVTKNGITMKFDSGNQCADYLGINRNTFKKLARLEGKVAGYEIRRLDSIETS